MPYQCLKAWNDLTEGVGEAAPRVFGQSLVANQNDLGCPVCFSCVKRCGCPGDSASDDHNAPRHGAAPYPLSDNGFPGSERRLGAGISLKWGRGNFEAG